MAFRDSQNPTEGRGEEVTPSRCAGASSALAAASGGSGPTSGNENMRSAYDLAAPA